MSWPSTMEEVTELKNFKDRLYGYNGIFSDKVNKLIGDELTTKRAELINEWEENYIRSKKEFGKLERKQFDEHWEKIKKLEQTKIKKQYEIFISILEKAARENIDLFPTGKKWSYFF
jgi:hypothetical protein